MKFALGLLMIDPAQFLDIARAADESGWDTIYLPDAPFFPEVTSVPYPYTPDGKRFWPPDTPFLNPWVAFAAMAAVTKRINFYPSVLRMAIRQPLLEANAIASVSVLSNGRVGLGVGLAWMPEEFKYVNEDMKNRGARVDEAIQIMRLVLGGGMVEFHGKYYDFDRLMISPQPKKPVPIYVGGETKPALRRAARYGDGWIGLSYFEDRIKEIVSTLNSYRQEFGRDKERFEIVVHGLDPAARRIFGDRASTDSLNVDDIRRLEDMGVTEFGLQPWNLYGGDPSRLDVKLDAIKRYGEEIIAKFR